ncbi:unnamed protein product, partial [Polarella glacialis]
MSMFRKGDEIYVFYRMGKRCRPERKYMAVLDSRHGAYRPRTGMSEGWLPARVTVDQDASRRGGEVCVEYLWPHFYTMRGNLTDPDNGGEGPWTEWFQADMCRKKDKDEARLACPGLRMVSLFYQPELAILAFRWGGMNEIIPPSQWGETGSSVSDLFLESFIDMAVIPKIGYNFEVWTVYIEAPSDLAKMADMAHQVFGAQHPMRRAKKVCGMYFLYPTAFEEGCVPTMETGEDHGAALVDQKSLFRAMQAVERAGIPTRFPHPSGFYELLASKRWCYYMACVPHLRVPPTIAVPRMLIEQDINQAAEWGLATLEGVKRNQAVLRGEPLPKGGITQGVAKLSFSWEALDVKMWKDGKQGLK